MKHNIPRLFAATFIAASVSTAFAETRLVNQGRSGFVVREVKERAPAAQRETRVVRTAPDHTKLRNFGRSGFHYRHVSQPAY